ncbi:intermembrane lipid transfer protein Vps13 isoform X2 [Neocloeon triangulifer]|uniref:intermembrane lipid transfer protein Vps13 isoform X2 n=1 Tax=Neocloeon triangulifer TaxID=2078957 RepID=UPI00286EE4F4|nr:intermembrane lipid transfer protein Vps13 isoform X2 [Neocloeon triangulifer]
MVLESVIVDVLNKFLGEYVESVDRKQLKVAFGGDIALDDLVLKQNALDELDLPVKTVYGRLGKLVLTIPWTNLYKAPWIVRIERVFLLSVPNEEVRYDPEKEDRLAQEAKQKEIARVEEAKKFEDLKGSTKKEDAGFVENLVAHIIKNVQVTIKDIHLRYEDRVTHPGSPFSLGVTLSSLKLMSTDGSGKPVDAKQILSIFHKVLEMEGLAFYWNPQSPLYSSYEEIARLQKFQEEIASKHKVPSGYNYMFGPISATAQLQLNPKPETDGSGFMIPKVLLDMNMNVLSIGISKMQYRDLVKFLESMDRMARAAPYRKYRPFINNYRGNYKAWWNFAYDCILETEIRRKRKNWDWNHIKRHRDRCRRYEKAFKEKLEAKKPSDELLKEIAELEKKIDVFNIIVLRKRAEVQVQKTRKLEEENKKNAGWFGGWFGGGSSADKNSGSDIATKIDAAMTKEEKQKLYQAIGYQENAAPTQYPHFYVAVKTSFTLGSLQVTVNDEDMTDSEVVKLVISGVKCNLEQRPSALATKVEMKMQNLKITGTSQNGQEPLLAYSLVSATLGRPSLLNILFETNPMDRLCDQRLRITAQPLEMIYEAETIIRITEVFKPPEKPSLKQLQAMAVSKLEDIQDRSATLLQHAIHQQKVLDLDIKVAASRMILPQLGKINVSSPVPVLVVSLGSLSIASCARDKGRPNITNMLQAGSSEQEVMQEMIAQSYEKFSLQLKDVQVLVAKPGEDWEEKLANPSESQLHLVQPMSIDINLHRSLLFNDPRIPQFKVAGQLPSLFLNLSEERLLLTAGILVSVPFPESEPEPQQPLTEGRSLSKSIMTLTQMGLVDKRKAGANQEGLDLVVSSVKMEIWFEMKELRVVITRKDAGANTKLVDFSLMAVEMEMIQRPFDMNLVLRLGGVAMDQTINGKTRKTITTPMSDGKADYLFTTRLLIVNRKSPEFSTVHHNVEKLLEVTFTSLDLALHQTGILQLMEFSQSLQDKISSLKPAPRQPKDRYASTLDPADRLLATIVEEDSSMTLKPVVSDKKPSKKIIMLKLVARLENLSVSLSNAERDLTQFSLRGVRVDIKMLQGQIEIDSALRTMLVTDSNPDTVYQKILESEGTEALAAKIIMYEKPAEGQPSMAVQANMARLRIFFLNRYVNSLLGFLNNFQAALNAIQAASAAAAEAAKQNIQQVYENATRIALAIEIKAPIVIVPRSTSTRDAFMLDLGTIVMNNKFTELQIPNESRTVSMDTLTLGLRHLHVTRVMLDNSNKAVSQTPLITPFDFTVLVKRNLSIGWCKLKPAIDLESQLDAIKLDVRQEDVKLGMLVLSENLGDIEQVIEPIEQVTVESLQTEEESVQKHARPKTLRTISTVSKVSEISAPVADNVFKNVTFNFLMKSIEVNLLVPATTPAGNDDRHGLAHFNISSMKVQGVMYSSGAMIVVLQLDDCGLKDMRRLKANSDNRISDLLSLKGTREKSPMILLNFNQSTANTTLTCKVSGFNLVLCLDYLLKISDFFVSALPQGNTPKVERAKSAGSKSASRPSSGNKKDSLTSKENVFELKVLLEKPDIILVESMSDINTRALIFSVEGDGRVRMTPERQAINFNIKNIQLYSCIFNPERRKETLSQVLRPCTLSVAGGCTTGDQPHIEVILSDVRLSVTPGTINILTNTMAALGSGTEETGEDEEKVQPDWSLLWRPKTFKETDHLFLLAEEGLDALSVCEALDKEQGPEGGEIVVTAGSFVITVEAGFGIKTLPLILLESSMQARVSNWARNLLITGGVSLQMSYYNSRLALWEPLIEPHVKGETFIPWKLNFELKKNATSSPFLSPLSDEVDAAPPPPGTSIMISSDNNLEITVSKSCLEVMTNLSKAFRLAVKEGPKVKELEGSPYQIINQTGIRVVLLLKDTNFIVDDGNGSCSGGVEQVVLESGAECGLILGEPATPAIDTRKSILNEQVHEKILQVRVPEKNCTIKIPMARAEKRYFSVAAKPEKQGIVSEVTVDGSCRIVTLRSIIQVHNQFSLPVDVYYMTKRGNEVECVGVVQPGQKLDLPLHAVYTSFCELFFSLPGHTVCITPFVWKELQNTITVNKLLQCDAKNKDAKEPYFIRAQGEMEHVYFEGTTMKTMHSCIFNITLKPTVVLKNLLPIFLVYASEKGGKELEVQPGGSIHLPTVEPGNAQMCLRLDDYLEKNWSCKREIGATPPELSVWSFDSYDSPAKMSLDMGMHTVNVNGTLYMSLYSPFWMINKTGKQLSYRKSRKTEKNEASGSPLKQSEDTTNVMYHPPDFEGPILFSFRPKVFFGKKKAAIRVEDSEWSNKFSLDVAGSSGSVSCKSMNDSFQIGVSIKLSSSNLTKLVTFTPYYMLVNHTSFVIQCQEGDRPADPWTDIEPSNCSPFWPRGIGHHDNTLRLKVKGTNETTSPFSFSENINVLLKLHNKFGGINVDVQVSEGNIFVNLSAYEPGLAPALIVNHTQHTVDFWEKRQNPTIKKLAPMEQALFAWEEPRGQRSLVWNGLGANNKKEEIVDMLRKDGVGKLWVSANNDEVVYWVSFLDGIQRVLLFTTNPEVATNAQAAAELEPISVELTMSLQGIGLSLVSELEKKIVELLYMRMASSGIIWECKKLKKRNYERLSEVDTNILELAYRRYSLGQGDRVVKLSDGAEADLSLNRIVTPYVKELRRTHNPGIWFHLKISTHQRMLHAKLNNLQIDCQMPNCMFPNILAPVPPPKSIAADNAMRPFVELSVVQRLLEHSPVQQFKYLRVLVQEFHVKLELDFLNALVGMFSAEETLDTEDTEKFSIDTQTVHQPLLALIAIQTAQEQKNFYDELHLSPLKIHISFSMSGGVGKLSGTSQLNIIHVLLENVGVTLTDIQDVVFKLGYFERQSSFLTQRQLISEAQSHYTQQAIKQLYVLVLGLDVIGNPFGLFLGLTQGVGDLFYEPFQGAIQGPGEFAEGLKNGVRSLFGHTLSGTAAAMSRITGTFGKTLANLSMDEEFQRRRREQQQSRPNTLHEGLAHSGKGLVNNVMSGVTGVITKPVTGARDEGVGGFFKGLGAGMLGLVTQPTGGVIDFASNTLESVKRAADTAEEQRPLRFSRFFQQDGLIRPYNEMEAFGNQLLHIVEKGKFAKTDNYVFHALLGNSGKEALIYTDNRVMFISKNDIFGQWQVDWNNPWSELSGPPKEDPAGIIFYTTEPQKKVLGFFRSSENGRTVIVQDEQLKKELYRLARKIMNDRIPQSPR